MITGPSGAGKSTVSEYITANSTGTWALISQDEIREHIKAGYRRADLNWDNETKKQWDVSINICCDMIRRYNETNINCIVELFSPPSEFEKWQEKINDLSYKLIVLLPSEEQTVYRNANRKSRMKESKIRENYEWFTQWSESKAIIIDTTKQSTMETIKSIEEIIRRDR